MSLGNLQYFLGVKVARSKEEVYLSKRKYVLDFLSEAGMSGCKPVHAPIDLNAKLMSGQGGVIA